MQLESIKKYWDSRALGYCAKSVDELCSDDAKLWTERLLAHLPHRQNLRCLDMGCGPGFLGILLGKLGHKVTFCDYSPKMLKAAEENAKASHIDYALHCCDAQEPNLCEEQFDVIVNRNLVWNLEKPEQAYKKWLNLLKPGGKLLIFDGNHYLYHYHKTYQEMKQNPQYVDTHTYEAMQGVDPNIMAEIAYNLPLSRFERPRWDVEFFQNNNVDFVQAFPVYKEFTGLDGQKKSIVDQFLICVEK